MNTDNLSSEKKHFYDDTTDTAFYLCPQCGKDIPENQVAKDVLFCSKRCQIAFRKERPNTWGPEFANYRRWVLGVGLGRGPKGIMPTDDEGRMKPIISWHATGLLLDAIHRVHDLGVFFGERAEKEGRKPFVSGGERMARLRRLMEQSPQQ